MSNVVPQKLLVQIGTDVGDETSYVVADSPNGAARSVLRKRGGLLSVLCVRVFEPRSWEKLLDSNTQPQVFDGLS